MEKPLVCITLRGRTVEEMVNDASKAEISEADIVEVRIDHLWTIEEKIRSSNDSGNSEKEEFEVDISQIDFNELDYEEAIENISSSISLPLMFTCRPQSQGGHFPGSEAERMEVLRKAISTKPDWIDLEIEIPKENRDELSQMAGKETKVIASMHPKEGIPHQSEITQEILDAIGSGDVVKACYNIKDKKEALRIFGAALDLASNDANFALMGLGPGGDWTRIHAPILGQHIVFATTESGWHLAQQGRINASDLMTAWELLEYC
tara:strand:- start:33 stop:824 length:792 start_codon:yes stop_codon:yes gene_type:complete